ncbi:uncharacterized protein LOC134197331 isoform X2 [Corticium candelabrum]|uniref:uncharacterized protein LOC134197331 isoform X2 n=1 Tax=Corticium candelabrum TaxID=121492 RepID=UPI002E253EC4|nr:uncharacterized protein LOC134197331 isoform X2 [Corticium candelabrum]
MAAFHTGTTNLHLPGLHSFLPRNETNAVMSQYLREDGWFLLRPSFSNQGLFSICVTFQGNVKHFKILLDQETGQYFVSSRRFPTIVDLLNCYKQVPLKSKNCQVFLRRDIPVDRERERLHMIHQGIEPSPSKQLPTQIQKRPLPTVPGPVTTKTLPRGRPLPDVPQQKLQKDVVIMDKTRRGTWNSDEKSQKSQTIPREKEKGLPPGWTEHFSQQHKRAYYYNAKTRETTWKRPQPPDDPNYVTMLQKSLHQEQKQASPVENGPPVIPPRQTAASEPHTHLNPPVRRSSRKSIQNTSEATSPTQKPLYQEMKSAPVADQPRNLAPLSGGRFFPSGPTRTPEKAHTAPPPLPSRIDNSGNLQRDVNSVEGQIVLAPARISGREIPPPVPNRQESGSLPLQSKVTRDPPPLPPNRDMPPPIPSRNDMSQYPMPPPHREENGLPPRPRRGEQAPPPNLRFDAVPPAIPFKASPPAIPKRAAPPPLPNQERTRSVAQLPVHQNSVKCEPSSSFHEYVNARELPPLPVKDDKIAVSCEGSPAYPPPSSTYASRSVAAVPAAPPLPPVPPLLPVVTPITSSSPMVPSAAAPPPPPPPLAIPPPIDEVPPSPRPIKHTKSVPPPSPNRDNSNLLDEIKAFGGGAMGRLRSASERDPGPMEPQVIASEGDIIAALKSKLMMVNAAARQDESDEEFEQVEDDDDWS